MSINEIYKIVLYLLKSEIITPAIAKAIMYKLVEKRIDKHVKPSLFVQPEEEVPF